jgi:carnitine O-palmitoyltransferase 2
MFNRVRQHIGNSQQVTYRYLSTVRHRQNDDYNYLKPSILSTDHFQYSLPRLPIPKLELTCERYLTALKPLLNDDDQAFERTRAIVNDFRTGDGQRLDAQLRRQNTANRHTSYISKPWFDMYLKSRLPMILNFNFFLVFTDDQRQLKAAARLTNYIVSSVRFMNSLRANQLDPEVYHLNPNKSNNDRFRQYLRYVPKRISFYGAVLQKAYPLDMSQYGRLFNSTRLPGQDSDRLVTNADNVRHIIVIKRGHYYKVNILDNDGQLLPAEKIAAMMKYLHDDVHDEDNRHPLGYFTADKRDRWASVREQLEHLSEHNRRCFKEIDSSIMVICLGKSFI